MSRRILRATVPFDDGSINENRRKIEVVAGWDRPLNRYHLTVYLGWNEDGDDTVLWDCLNLDRPELLTFRDITLIVRGFIHNPSREWAIAVLEDGTTKSGNVVSVTYQEL